MENKTVLRIGFGSFVKLSALSGLGLGVVAGILALIMGVFGGDVSFNAGTTVITGPVAGVINLFFFPIIFWIASAFGGMIAFLPFKFLVLKILKGVNLKLEFSSMS